MTLQTEFEFTLPQGYVDDEGTLHEEGRMRLATAADEIAPAEHPQVQSNASYPTIALLSRVVTELGDLETVDAGVIEDLFVTDLEYLQAMYERINTGEGNLVETTCPDCNTTFEADAESGLPADGPDLPGSDGLPASEAGQADVDRQALGEAIDGGNQEL
jgi:hypothetical protein